MQNYTTLISVDKLAVALAVNSADKPLIIFDCRFSLADSGQGSVLYDEGHIEGAIYAHLDNDLAGEITPETGRHPLPGIGDFIARLGIWGVTSQSQVVVYDDAGGAIAARLWWMLKWVGHQKVALLDGGYSGWVDAKNPISTAPRTISEYGSTDKFIPKVDNQLQIELPELVGLLDEAKINLFDARAKPRFHGEHEPIDPVAGHIPGAINLPLELNLEAGGKFKSASELKNYFQDVLGELNHAENPVAHMCGSGVTACHNILAMEIAGIGNTRLYVGSWSEWIRDPKRPVSN